MRNQKEIVEIKVHYGFITKKESNSILDEIMTLELEKLTIFELKPKSDRDMKRFTETYREINTLEKFLRLNKIASPRKIEKILKVQNRRNQLMEMDIIDRMRNKTKEINMTLI